MNAWAQDVLPGAMARQLLAAFDRNVMAVPASPKGMRSAGSIFRVKYLDKLPGSDIMTSDRFMPGIGEKPERGDTT